MLVGTWPTRFLRCLKVENKSRMQSCDVEESRRLPLQSDAFEQSACMRCTEMFVRDEEEEWALGRALTISVTREARTHFDTITLLGEEQPQSV